MATITQFVAVADLLRCLGRPVMRPRRRPHLAATALEQRVVDYQLHRLVGRHQQRGDQSGQDPTIG